MIKKYEEKRYTEPLMCFKQGLITKIAKVWLKLHPSPTNVFSLKIKEKWCLRILFLVMQYNHWSNDFKFGAFYSTYSSDNAEYLALISHFIFSYVSIFIFIFIDFNFVLKYCRSLVRSLQTFKIDGFAKLLAFYSQQHLLHVTTPFTFNNVFKYCYKVLHVRCLREFWLWFF